MFWKIECFSFFRVNELLMNNEKSVLGELYFIGEDIILVVINVIWDIIRGIFYIF